jgi:hypothetical protein
MPQAPVSIPAKMNQQPPKINNPFEGTVCASQKEVDYFIKTVPFLHGKNFRAKRIF